MTDHTYWLRWVFYGAIAWLMTVPPICGLLYLILRELKER